MALMLNKKHIAHLLSSVAAITGGKSFVIVGTGAVIARIKNVPLDMMTTRELDIYPEGPGAELLSDLIDGTLGEGSQFDNTFGYYAHGVGERTACMPADWKTRAQAVEVPGHPEVTCLCPEPHDVAIAKACAWREKDQDWLIAGLTNGVLKIEVMLSRIGTVHDANAPDIDELTRRIVSLPKTARALAIPALQTGPRSAANSRKRTDDGGAGL